MEQIDLKIAKQMVDRYQTTRKSLIDSTLKINDTASVWFDIAAFKEFAEQLPPEATGVRIYLATYGDDKPVSPNQTTVIFVGTIAKDGNAVDAILHDTPASAGLGPSNGGKDCPPVCN